MEFPTSFREEFAGFVALSREFGAPKWSKRRQNCILRNFQTHSSCALPKFLARGTGSRFSKPPLQSSGRERRLPPANCGGSAFAPPAASISRSSEAVLEASKRRQSLQTRINRQARERKQFCFSRRTCQALQECQIQPQGLLVCRLALQIFSLRLQPVGFANIPAPPKLFRRGLYAHGEREQFSARALFSPQRLNNLWACYLLAKTLDFSRGRLYDYLV